MTNQRDPQVPEVDVPGPVPASRRPDRRGRIVLVWSVMVLFIVGAAIAGNWQSNRHLDEKVDRGIARSHQIEKAVDSVRLPVCTIMYASLSRPVVGLTPEQVKARAGYYRAYGPGTEDQRGLNCPLPLPPVR